MDIGGRFLPEEDYETDPASLVAVIVAGPSNDEAADLLQERGWDVRHCPGPHQTVCPLLQGEPCAIRERSDAAIVYSNVTPPDLGDVASLVMCAAHRSSPAVAVISGDVTALDPLEKTPVLSENSPAEIIVDAMEEVAKT